MCRGQDEVNMVSDGTTRIWFVLLIQNQKTSRHLIKEEILCLNDWQHSLHLKYDMWYFEVGSIDAQPLGHSVCRKEYNDDRVSLIRWKSS